MQPLRTSCMYSNACLTQHACLPGSAAEAAELRPTGFEIVLLNREVDTPYKTQGTCNTRCPATQAKKFITQLSLVHTTRPTMLSRRALVTNCDGRRCRDHLEVIQQHVCNQHFDNLPLRKIGSILNSIYPRYQQVTHQKQQDRCTAAGDSCHMYMPVYHTTCASC